MTPHDVYELLVKLFAQDTRKTAVYLAGGPGIGKTAMPAAAAAAVGKQIITFALPTCESVDLRGLPQIINNQTHWASPMPRDGQGVIVLDELSSAPPDVQVAAHHLVWAEPGSEMSIPAGWHIVLTGNRAQDKTVYRAMSGPLRNRLTLINVDADAGQWCRWAMDRGVHPHVVAFIRWRPELLVAKETPSDGAFPTPRAWTRASDVLSLNCTDAVERELLAGTVGEGATTEFAAYLRMARELPSLEAIMADPTKAEVPQSPSLLYALTTGLAQYSAENRKSAFAFVTRMPAEFALVYIKDITEHYKRTNGARAFDISKDADIRAWIGKHKSLFAKES